MFANNSISVENLNDQPFPSGYLFTDGTGKTIVTGQKSFNNILGKQSSSFRTKNKVREKIKSFDFDSISQ